MKFNLSIGYAKYETLELLIGIILNVVGGIFIGKTFEEFSFLFIILAIIITIIGIFLELRVLRKHIQELRSVRLDISRANKRNSEAIKEINAQKELIQKAKYDLDEVSIQIKNQIEDLEKTKKDVFSSSITGRSSGALEDSVRKLRDRVQKIEEKLGFSSFIDRRNPW